MVKFELDNSSLTLRVTGIDRLWALTRRIEAGLMQVASARVEPEAARGRKGRRVLGTRLPGVLTAGAFQEDGRKSFWLVRGGSTCVVVDLVGHEYDRIVAEVDDPEGVVAAIHAAKERASAREEAILGTRTTPRSGLEDQVRPEAPTQQQAPEH